MIQSEPCFPMLRSTHCTFLFILSKILHKSYIFLAQEAIDSAVILCQSSDGTLQLFL